MIRIALIGCGYWGKNYIGALAKLSNVELAWIYNPHTVIAQASLPTGCKFTNDYAELLADQSVSAVIIATPVETHYRLAKVALEHGKDVLLEKPMTDNVKQARELDSLAKKLKRVLMVGHIFMFHPAVLKLQELIQNNELGRVKYIYSRRSGPGPVRLGTNAMWNLAPHDITISNLLTSGSPLKVWAQSINNKDTFLMTLDYGKAKTVIYVSWSEPVKTRETIVVGERKTAIFNDSLEQKLKLYDNIDRSQIVAPLIDDVQSPLEKQCQHFLHCLETRERPLASGGDGALNVEILEQAQESIRANKEVTR